MTFLLLLLHIRGPDPPGCIILLSEEDALDPSVVNQFSLFLDPADVHDTIH